MKIIKILIRNFLLFLLFWILLFDVQRLLFSVIHFDVFEKAGISFPLIFIHSLRLDLATAGFLSVIPLFFLLILKFYNHKWLRLLFYLVVGVEILAVSNYSQCGNQCLFRVESQANLACFYAPFQPR